MNTTGQIITWVLIGIAIILGVSGFILNAISDNNCEKLCDQKNALAHQTFASGGWDTNDICVCYFPNEIKTWRMK